MYEIRRQIEPKQYHYPEIHKLEKAITRINIDNILISGLKEKLDIFIVNAEKENKV